MQRFIVAIIAVLFAVIALPPGYYAVFPTQPAEFPPAGRSIQIADGVAVNALEQGSGALVVLVHGMPGSAYDWKLLSQALAARGRRILAYDRVGYGHSDARVGGDFTMLANGRELIQLLEREGECGATVVGWSYGGGASIHAAGMDPSRIGRLVLIGSAGPANRGPEQPAIFAVLFSAPVMNWMAAVPPISRRVQRAMSVWAFSGQPMPDWWLLRLAGNFATANTRVTYRNELAQYAPDRLDPTPIELPILVIQGDDDRLIPLAVGRGLDRLARHSEFMIVQGGSHMLPVTHAELLADRIITFEESTIANTNLCESPL